VKYPLHVALAILAAALYALAAPLSKILLIVISPVMLAGLLYAGAGVGMTFVGLFRNRVKKATVPKFGRTDMPYLILMVALDVAAPILLLLGLTLTTAANASLLNNFEIVATSLFAMLAFRETITRRLWVGIAFVTMASVLLSLGDGGAFAFAPGSLLILAAATCWGLENNCTRMLSTKDPLAVVVVKGLCSGAVSLSIAAILGMFELSVVAILAALAVGFVAYGLSIFCYVTAQSRLGAAKTSAYYAVAPFIGAGLSLAIFQILPAPTFFIALGLLAIGAWFTSTEGRKHAKSRTS
jgi:drug/metabolite transporter (DMT)-like permease